VKKKREKKEKEKKKKVHIKITQTPFERTAERNHLRRPVDPVTH